MSERPVIVTLCGSSRFVQEMAVCAWIIERDEGSVALGLHLLPAWYPGAPSDHLAEAEGCAKRMDALHLHKVAMADEVFVVNVDGYIGESTANEVRHARALGKTLRWYTEDPVGSLVETMLFKAGYIDRRRLDGGE